MSVVKLSEQLYEVRWREDGRQKTQRIHGSYDLARKILRKKLLMRDENRHLDVKKEINYRMSELIDRYWTHYARRLPQIARRASLRESDPNWVGCSYERLTALPFNAGTRTSRGFAVLLKIRQCGTSTSCTT